MYPLADSAERKNRSQGGNKEKEASKNLSIEDNKATNENICSDEEYIFETSGTNEEIEYPTKTTKVHPKKENTLLKKEEERRKLWYFAHV
ncbi:MAG: hypothetical protein ACBZ72_07825 [Candidatus Bathyarchaeia archaeon]|jgi:hypothetical protein